MVSKIFCIFAPIKVLSGLAHVKLMPVGGWCDKRFAEWRNAKITVSSFGNGSIEQVPEYANHGLLFHSQVIMHYRVLVTQKCRLVTGVEVSDIYHCAVLVTQKCRLVTGLAE